MALSGRTIIACLGLVWLTAQGAAALEPAAAPDAIVAPGGAAVPATAAAPDTASAPGRAAAPAAAAAPDTASAPALLTPPAAVASDTLVWREAGEALTADRLKELLQRETGEPEIEGALWRRRKNPRVAMLCALAVPGLGQMYNEKPLKALIAVGLETYYVLNIVHWYRKERREQSLRDSYEKFVPCGPDGMYRCINSSWRFHDVWMEEYKARKIDWVWWSSAAVLAIMLDAYVDAHLHDMRFRVDAPPGGGAGLAVVVDF